MLMVKCTVLAAINDDHAGIVIAFRKLAESAREMQKNASALLRKELLEDTLAPQEIAALARVEYAKQTTSIAVDYVSAGTFWEELPSMLNAIETVHAYHAAPERADAFPLELAALDWVRTQIRYANSLPH
ncbi:hypothetical protein [Hydrogenophaga sp. BPS33]|uniref:hypothetical protein n=1 Tax=Hydrogenophaga sp. BPS33 TaxID=2651974 RepID=UPI00131FC43A|nr:hypothetical protein [Hydrogenophaga sp. BPS33]QHE84420.1 hypothetical protein F9K07_05720 [Hydrogenophaga sp. BPS33]